MRKRTIFALVVAAALGWSTGCKKEVNKGEFISAIDASLAHHHDCVWPAPVKMPAQADASKDEATRGYDALVDAGLLIRTPEEKKRFLIGSKQVNDYDLSDKGHSSWTPDPSQPGYGNFCFGHFNVTAVDSFKQDPTNPSEYTVNYEYEVEGIPSWANTAESRLAFPKIAADTSIQNATVTVVKGSNGGWAVVPPQPAPTGQ
ncbi:MAG TPA: hypothetical protein VMU48_01055 [Terracidiphilus sp.]|nr:hypothetical protein [Terracidiphilus sp.]